MSNVAPVRSGETDGPPAAADAAGTAEAPPAPAGWPARFGRAARLAAPAIGLYLVLRVISLQVMAALAASAHERDPGRAVYWDGSTNQWRGWTSVTDALMAWDARWYALLAGQGVRGPLGAVDENGVPYELRLMFFPLYPWLARPLAQLPFVSPTAAVLTVSLVSAIAAAWGIYAVGTRLHGRRLGIVLAGLWAVVPSAMTQNGGFSESLFTALAAWALYAVLDERWLTAGLLAGVSGLSRPTAAALIGAVGLAALVAAVRRRGGWRPYAAMLIAPAGLLGYVGYASYRLGGVGRYFDIHHNTFGAHWDYGRSHWDVIKGIMLGVNTEPEPPVRLLSVLFLFGFVAFLVLAALKRTPWPLMAYAVATLVLAVGSWAHISMIGRHLLPVFPVLLVPALVLARASNRTIAVVLGVLALTSGWYAGWLPFISGQGI